MSVNRAAVADYLHEQFSALAASVGQAMPVATGYAPDINNALRKLGKTESELAAATAEDGQRDAVFALAEYYAARRLWRLLADRVDHVMGETSYRFDGQRKQAQAMMEDAQRRCIALGYDVTGSGWSVGHMNLDWLEPEILP